MSGSYDFVYVVGAAARIVVQCYRSAIRGNKVYLEIAYVVMRDVYVN